MLSYAGQTQRSILAQQMQSEWRAVGGDVSIQPVPPNVLFARDSMFNKADYDVALDGFIFDPDPDRSVNFGTRYFSPIGYNAGRFSDAETDALLARGISSYDRTERKAVYAQLQRRLNDLAAFIPLAWPETIYVYNNDLHGFRPEPINSDLWNVQDWRI